MGGCKELAYSERVHITAQYQLRKHQNARKASKRVQTTSSQNAELVWMSPGGSVGGMPEMGALASLETLAKSLTTNIKVGTALH